MCLTEICLWLNQLLNGVLSLLFPQVPGQFYSQPFISPQVVLMKLTSVSWMRAQRFASACVGAIQYTGKIIDQINQLNDSFKSTITAQAVLVKWHVIDPSFTYCMAAPAANREQHELKALVPANIKRGCRPETTVALLVLLALACYQQSATVARLHLCSLRLTWRLPSDRLI